MLTKLVARASIALVAMTAVACTIGQTQYETEDEPITTPNATKTCDGPFQAPDLSKLTSCGDGKGHCFDGAKTAMTDFPACTGSDVCVPDKLLTLNGGKLKACTFFLGNAPGACMSTLSAQVAAHKDQLQQDVCDADERCIPCTNPTDGSDTHACEAGGVYENACKGGSGEKQITCCHGAGICLNKSAVPADQRDKVSQETCPDAKICAPSAFVSGKPVKCSALGFDGVCIDVCFAQMLSPAGSVIRASCKATEVCLPCVVGSGEGVPGC